MSVILIKPKPVEILIDADHRLAFEVITAFRSARSNPVRSVRVLERWDEQGRLLAEFDTPMRFPFGLKWTVTTTEFVEFDDPWRVDFSLAEPTGLLVHLEDRFLLDKHEDQTLLRYESVFGLRGGILGWAFGHLVVKRLIKRHMREHLESLKSIIEARARRSHAYPRSQTAQAGVVSAALPRRNGNTPMETDVRKQ
jgi:hypothetical protein